MKIVVMQPYFIPYAGYFRLFLSSDLFVIYDCVQFPRRGWVHRNKLYNQQGDPDWLTIPLEKQSRDIKINSLKFKKDVDDWKGRLLRFPVLRDVKQYYPSLYECLSDLSTSPLSYVVRCLREICSLLDIGFNVRYSSELNIPENIKGQDRVITIAKYFNATNYINAPSGRDLYDETVFNEHGIKLSFLPDYSGEFISVINSFFKRDKGSFKNHLISQC